MKLIVEDMTCGHCVRRITQAIQAVDATAKVEVDLAEAEVQIDGDLDIASAIMAIGEAGYSVVTILESGRTSEQKSQSKACCGGCA